ncbi:MAG: Ig-like domain-containing protein, partial [Rhodanobacter sp.]
MENHPGDITGQITLSFPAAAINYFGRYEKLHMRELEASAKVTLLQPPKHGQLISGDTYRPDVGYHGKDKVVALVEIGGYRVKVAYFIQVFMDKNVGDNEETIRKYCGPKGDMWKISLQNSPTDTSAIQSLLSFTGSTSATSIEVSDLANGAVGSTQGNTITLDDNAAGYNWFIDPTPADNSEFLPTSNPNEWIAKADSDAAGKMDMLSVLLHEYGHALGIEHSADSGDYMATTLQPGVRRLPSTEELALMAQLVGEIKSGSNGAPDTPQSPSLPIGTTLSALLIGRLRRTAYGSWSPVFDSVQIPAPAVQFEIAANPTLTDPKLQTGTGWETQGSVSIGNGAAILAETSTSQTRLNQVFIVGEHDRYLSFTVAGIGLDDQANGPDDAFEAGLLDANSGASLAGTIGLTHSDALLNLQADGSEFVGQGITSTANADGSRTYRIDLSGIPASTAVNLSFDLIGFGAATSQVTVRDIRIGIPEARDDSVATLEDTALTIAALANDLDADQPGFVPAVVAGPTHGTVTLAPDGSFSYAPEANYYGEDSFTYKLSDGAVDSNIASVSISIASVNDAPVVQALSATTAEDTPLSLDLLTQASDVEGSQLTPVIVAGPQHGRLSVVADGGVTYDPDADYNGGDSFTYKVNDGELDSDEATVILTVTAVNDAPVANADGVTTDEDTPLSISAASLLANDTDVDTGDTKTLAFVTGGAAGTSVSIVNGDVVYNPGEVFQFLNAGKSATDTFTYTMQDSAGAQSTATVTVTIAGSNDAAVITGVSSASLSETDTVLTTTGSLSATDVDSSNAFVVQADVAGSNGYGLFAVNASGAWTYATGTAHDEFVDGQLYTDSFTVATADGTQQVVTVAITGTDDRTVITGVASATLTE